MGGRAAITVGGFEIMKCWICGGLANSREHKFKKSDLIRSSTTWAPDDRPYFVAGGVKRPIASPNAKIATTFGKVLCVDCNSARTQPFDRAYEAFSRYVNQTDRACTQPRQHHWIALETVPLRAAYPHESL